MGENGHQVFIRVGEPIICVSHHLSANLPNVAKVVRDQSYTYTAQVINRQSYLEALIELFGQAVWIDEHPLASSLAATTRLITAQVESWQEAGFEVIGVEVPEQFVGKLSLAQKLYVATWEGLMFRSLKLVGT